MTTWSSSTVLCGAALGVHLLIKKNLLSDAQFLAKESASPIALAPAGQATSLRTILAKATIRTGMFFAFLLPAASWFKDSIHTGQAPEATIVDRLVGFHIVPHPSQISILTTTVKNYKTQ